MLDSVISRPFWTARLAHAWKQASVVWLTGVRRVGKTVLAQSLPDAEFLNCDLPSVARRLHDPEAFLAAARQRTLVFDEIHQLPDPSRVLKIAADAFPKLKVLATGSSTLAATRKFRDSLAGRKHTVELVPVLLEESAAFGVSDVRERLLRGGLPPALLTQDRDLEFYAEWLDSYFARDVQELFRVGKRGEFLKLLELLLRQSGGLLEITSLAKHVGVARPTVTNWLDVLEITHVLHLLRPYQRGGRREILAQAKVYGFDTGFVAFARGWEELREEDCGSLWEHLVLDTLLAIPEPKIHFWRDKQQREVDFVLPRGREAIDAIECKWNVDAFEPRGLAAFRQNYPRGRNFLVGPATTAIYPRRFGNLHVMVVPLKDLRKALQKAG
jgi:predicted AAA+ superfamily ATPase